MSRNPLDDIFINGKSLTADLPRDPRTYAQGVMKGFEDPEKQKRSLLIDSWRSNTLKLLELSYSRGRPT